MSPNFDSLYLWKTSSPPLCVIHIQKRLDLLCHLVFPKFVLCCENPTQIAMLENYRFSQIITILGLIPIVNEVISRCCAFWFNFLYDFIYYAPNIHDFLKKVPVSALKYHFDFEPPSGLKLDLNLTPPHNLIKEDRHPRTTF